MFIVALEVRSGGSRARHDGTTALHGAPQLSGIVTETTVRPACHDQGITLELIVGHDVAEPIAGDRTRLTTVLANLLTNALKYSPPGATVVVEATSGGTGSAPVVRLTVAERARRADRISRASVRRVFSRRARTARIRRRRARVRHRALRRTRDIFEAHGGSLACVQSLSDCGARFLLRLPAGKDEEPSSRP